MTTRNRSVPLAATLEVRDACLCMHAQRAARALARRFDGAFRPLNLTNGQFSLLMSLNRPGATPMGRIVAFLAMDRTTLTAALKPLERRKLVKISADPADSRARLIGLTRAGRALLAEALPIWRAHHRVVEKGLGRSARDLRRELNILSQAS